jgi:TonB family protein
MSRIVLSLFCSLLLVSGGAPCPKASSFEVAELVSAADDLRYPPQSIAVGTVVLEITVDGKGAVESVRTIREIPSLTEAAVESVRNWHFKPAILDGKPVRSRTVAAVTFNPLAAFPQNVPLPPLSAAKPRASRTVLEPRPVKVVAASFPQYPVNSVITGTVVLRVSVDSEGHVADTVAIRDIVPLAAACIRVLEEWKFEPAQYQGMPIPASIALVFVLRPPPG